MGSSDSSHQKERDVPSFKIVLVGAPKSGKSSVFLRYIKNQHVPYYTATRKPVIENVVRKLNIPGHAVVSVTLWDLPGREDMDIRSAYFRNVDAAIVVVDMSDENSIEMAGVWRREVLNQATRTSASETTNNTGLVESRNDIPVRADDVPVILLGNKYDIVDRQLQASQEQVHEDTSLTDVQEQMPEEVKDDDTSWNYNPSFPRQRGPEPGEEKPTSVKLMEKVSEEHNFLASVMVSSSANDGSVEGAIQSLIRYLVMQKYPHTIEKWRPITSSLDESKKGEANPTDMELLHVEQFDEIFKQCDSIVKHVDRLCSVQTQALQRFKQACFILGVLETRKSNIETCIECLNEAFPNDNPLQIVAKGGFYHLEVQTTRELNLRKDIKTVFDVFNLELAASSISILKDFPKLINTLESHEEQLAVLCDQTDILTDYGSADEIRQAEWKVERNRAQITYTHKKAEEACDYTRAMAEKISLAMVW